MSAVLLPWKYSEMIYRSGIHDLKGQFILIFSVFFLKGHNLLLHWKMYLLAFLNKPVIGGGVARLPSSWLG